MNKLLTIAIPTYNRCTELDKQLQWLSEAIQGYETECHILVSDNCSMDGTPDVIKNWQTRLKNISFQVNRHSRNIGLMPNLAFCIQQAKSDYLWIVGDDDDIKKEALAYVIESLKTSNNLSLLNLNTRFRDVRSGEITYEKYFEDSNNELLDDGQRIIEKYLEKEKYAGLAFMTAQVYRTTAIKCALQVWKTSLNNLEGQLFWTAFCALQGRVKFSQEVFVTYNFGTNDIVKPKVWFRMRYRDLPKVYFKLMKVGYCRNLCQKLIAKQFKIKHDFRILLGIIRRYPAFGVRTMASYYKLLLTTAFQEAFPNQIIEI